MKIETDSRGNQFTELRIRSGGRVRLVLVEEASGPCLRFEGPPIPLDRAPEFLACMVSLMAARRGRSRYRPSWCRDVEPSGRA